MRAIVTSLLLIIATLPPSQIEGQVSSIADETGYKPYATFQFSDFDSVNLSNLKLDLHIPLLKVPQRGGKLNVSYDLAYTPNTYSYDVIPCDTTTIYDVNGDPEPGPCIDEAHFEFFNSGGGMWIRPSFGLTLIPSYNLSTPFGSHQLYYKDDQHAYTTDGSGYQVVLPGNCLMSGANATVVDSNGITSTLACNQPVNGSFIRDSNGNTLTYNNSTQNPLVTITDTLGNVLPALPQFAGDPFTSTASNFAGCTGPFATSSARFWTVPSVEGQTLQYKFCYGAGPAGQYSVNCADDTYDSGTDQPGTFQGCPGTLTASASGGGYQSIVLPNGTSYTFEYDTGSATTGQPAYGDLTKITLPSGGTITYTWADLTAGAGFTDYIRGFSFARAVSTRTINANDGTGAHTWTYKQGLTPPVSPYVQADFAGSQQGASYSIVVTDPEGNDTVHTFIDPVGGHESSTQYYQGAMSSSTLINEVRTDYQWIAQQNSYPINVLPIRRTTVWAGGDTTATETDYDHAGPNSISLGIVTGNRVYDFGSGGVGPLERSQAEHFLWQDNAAYLSAGLLQTPSAICVSGSKLTGCTSPAGMAAFTAYLYDETGSPAGTHGNQTSTKRWINTNSSYLTSSKSYNTLGMPTAVTENGVTRSILYDNSELYPSEIDAPTINGISHKDWFSYDHVTGALLTHTDENGSGAGDPQHTTVYHHDIFGRLLSATYPLGSVQYQYTDGPNSTVTQTKAASPDPAQISVITLDGLGRASDAQTMVPSAVCSGGVVHKVTTYDPLGRQFSVSNPYCTSGDPTFGSTSYSYDPLGRQTQKMNPDSTFTKTAYQGGQTVINTDEAGVQKKFASDGLGLLRRVWELGTPGQPLSLQTEYSYDTLGNLTGVNQHGTSSESSRTRSFTYDTLSRLVTAINPESGTICYGQWSGGVPGSGSCQGGYDGNDNLTAKTDASGMVVNFSYDGLNRVSTKTSAQDNGSTNVTYSYDAGTNGVGHLFKETNGNSSGSQFGYDAMGRTTSTAWYDYVHQAWQSGIQLKYDLAGNVTQMTYPNGATLDQSWDAAGNLRSIVDVTPSGPGTTYFQATNGTAYYPSGQLKVGILGNGVVETRTVNNRLQMCQLLAETPTQNVPGLSTDSSTGMGILLNRKMFYAGSAETLCGHAPGNNGNIWHILEENGGQQNFAYDSLNRLSAASSANRPAAASYNFSFVYDSFGNMLPSDNLTGYNSYSIDPSTNRILNGAGIGYSANGNVTATNGHTLSYTSEELLKSIDNFGTGSYLYNGLGQRTLSVRENYGSDSSFSASQNVYLNGQTLAEYHIDAGSPASWTTAPWTWTNYVYAKGEQIARLVGTATGPTVSYYLRDQPGTAQMEVSSNGVPAWSGWFTPFGQEIIGGWATNYVGSEPADGTTTRYKFTGKERDQESGLDYFGARYYGSSMGRFMSPDPITVTSARQADPQQLNLYSYVRNNPLSLTDPSGMIINTDDLNDKDKALWAKIVALANKQDANGNYVNPALHGAYSALDGDSRTFRIEDDKSLGDSTAGRFEVTKFSGANDFSEAKVELNFGVIKGISSTTQGDYDPSFKKYDGLFGKNGFVLRLAETFGHEANHGIFAINDPAQGVNIQRLVNDAHGAVNGARQPIPPDVLLKVTNMNHALEPTERFAQQQEKVINKELQQKQ